MSHHIHTAIFIPPTSLSKDMKAGKKSQVIKPLVKLDRFKSKTACLFSWPPEPSQPQLNNGRGGSAQGSCGQGHRSTVHPLNIKWQFRSPIRVTRKPSSPLYSQRDKIWEDKEDCWLPCSSSSCQPCEGQDDGMMPNSCYWVSWHERTKKSMIRQSPPAYITVGNALTFWLINTIPRNLFYINTSCVWKYL